MNIFTFCCRTREKANFKRRSHFYDHSDTDPDLELLFVIQAKSFKMSARYVGS